MRPPPPDDVVPVVDALAWQERFCRDRGAPVSADVLAGVLSDVRSGGSLAAPLPATVRVGDRVGLRVLAAVHRLVLDGEATTLVGRDAEAIADEATRALLAHPRVLTDYLSRVPQTNEVSRGRQLRRVLAGIERPVRLVEVGASAGLNLRPEVIAPDPDVSPRLPVIVERLGCDLHPLDVRDPSDVGLLCSYVWMEDSERLATLRQALDDAVAIPVVITDEPAVAFVEGLTLRPGADTIVWHSAVLPYLEAVERERLAAAIDALGARAAPDARLVHATWERDGQDVDDAARDHVLMVRVWSGGDHPEVRTLVRGSTHGVVAFDVGAGA